jgi:hypothetical protein
MTKILEIVTRDVIARSLSSAQSVRFIPVEIFSMFADLQSAKIDVNEVAKIAKLVKKLTDNSGGGEGEIFLLLKNFFFKNFFDSKKILNLDLDRSDEVFKMVFEHSNVVVDIFNLLGAEFGAIRDAFVLKLVGQDIRRVCSVWLATVWTMASVAVSRSAVGISNEKTVEEWKAARTRDL